MKYGAQKRAEALARITEIGVQKTSEEMNISIQTLYKWRNELKGGAEIPASAVDVDALRQAIESEEAHAAALKRQEDENARLREENAKLRQENARLRIAVKAFIG